MAEAVVSVALETIADLVIEEGRFLFGVGDEVQALHLQLKEIKCLLRDADRRQHESKTLSYWIVEIRDLTYRAEDAIHRYAIMVSSKRGRGLQKLLKRFSCIMNEFHSHHQIESEISEINSDLARVSKSMQDYGIRIIIQGETSITNDNQQWERKTFPDFEIGDFFVGKDDELKRIVSLLVDDDHKQHRVVSIWGMSGLGKTTIARKAYHHGDTKHFFQGFAWVCITQQFNIRSVLEDVLKQLNPSKKDVTPSMNNRELIEELCQIQKAKPCIIVLDDLWEIDHWDGMKCAFLVEGLKSKILVTTRNEKVAEIGCPIQLGVLNMDNGWELLKMKAFPGTNTPVGEIPSESFEEIGRQVVQECGGLPLAISVYGAILCQQPLKKWVEVCNNLRHGMDTRGELHKMLNLSYDDLLYELKLSFLYLACFPKGQEIDTEQLYLLWNAERLLFWKNNGALREVAENYLTELAYRSMVQVEKSGFITPHKKFESCRLHASMHDFCSAKAQEDNFIKFVSITKHQHDINSTIGDVTKRLVIHLDDDDDDELQEEKEEVASSKISTEHLRSFLFLCKSRYIMRATNFQNIFDLESSKNLWILVLDGVIFEDGNLPSSIGKQKYVKYLSLRHSYVQELPKHVCDLLCLQTLDLRVWRTIKLPNLIWKMKSLQHLFLPSTIEVIGGHKLNLNGLDKLETLKGINSTSVCIADVVELKKLQRLSAKIEDMDSLSKIVDYMSSDGCQLHETDLTIESCDLRNVLPKMVMIPSLVCLHIIECKIGSSITPSDEQAMCPNLVKLTIVNSKIVGDFTKLLGKFPMLQYLSLHGDFIGELRGALKAELTFGVDSFPELKQLMLINLMNLHKWEVEVGAMPQLEELRIWQCRNLKKLPDELRFIQTLQVLQCYGVSKELKSRMRQCYGSEDYTKFSHIPSIHIRW